MKKIALSLSAFVATSLMAGTITLYQDKDSGAIYTKPGPNRVKLGDFISVQDIAKQNQKIRNEMTKEIKGTKVFSKVPKLKINGVHYLGYHYTDYDDKNRADKSTVETRRNYLQVKAYWNKHDYARITLDTHQQNNGDWVARLKYAYLYLSNILPFTGVEFGQVHRPWIDYAEHHGWLYRSISETFVETRNAAHVINSASPGINFKTKTDYFTSEIGLFNNGGYHSVKSGTGQSFEWRLTYEALGTGKKHVHATSDEWLNISFFGRYLTGTDNGQNKDTITGLHAVYNTPMFLIGGYLMKNDNNGGPHDGKGWSVNGEFRPIKDWSILARYDHWKVTPASNIDYTKKNIIAGVAYTYNKNVKFIANIDKYTDDQPNNSNKIDYLLTAEVHW
ncbi:hypothetical protein [Nitratiruptor tergarcus]|uniref:Phosphate-selective porin O and P n=1 Tax=Nitratiruptor tergarcus DSM 16512 TaxID=1069081 RepID=A0A1W1WVJ4_9BACT|nr:hypothetical protein [Nitratiruptor tergarcus]SMC09753.1 hypothetical protein SAMN05660197_1575 [Nitratiruptor tergarcus DSM 16512]